MSIETLVEQAPVHVGQRVRDARNRHGWTLDQLAQASAVSRRMIVNVEAGHSNASIATLLRLASALHVTLADLVAEPPSQSMVVTSASDRKALWSSANGGSAVMITSTATPDMLEQWEWCLEPGDDYQSGPHVLGARELLHVHSGTLHLTVDATSHELRSGDAVSFNADVPHSYANLGRRATRFAMTVFEPILRVRP